MLKVLLGSIKRRVWIPDGVAFCLFGDVKPEGPDVYIPDLLKASCGIP